MAALVTAAATPEPFSRPASPHGGFTFGGLARPDLNRRPPDDNRGFRDRTSGKTDPTITCYAASVLYHLWCVFAVREILGGVTSTEHIRAIVTAWFVSWALTTWGMDPTPAFIVAWILWAAICGNYRRRWANPTTA